MGICSVIRRLQTRPSGEETAASLWRPGRLLGGWRRRRTRSRSLFLVFFQSFRTAGRRSTTPSTAATTWSKPASLAPPFDGLPVGGGAGRQALTGGVPLSLSHVNRRTQFENPVLEAKRRLRQQVPGQGLSSPPPPAIYGGEAPPAAVATVTRQRSEDRASGPGGVLSRPDR